MEKIKVLFYIDCLSSGGKERRLTELMKALKMVDSVDFELVVMNREIHFKEVLELGIPIHYLVRKTKKDVTIGYKLFKICKTIKPDLIHCWDNMTAVYGVIVASLLNIQFVNGMVTNTLQSKSLHNKYWVRAMLTFPFSDYIVGNSYAGIKSYNAPVAKTRVIYNGFNFDRLKSLKSKELIRKELGVENELVVGMVASFSKNKDYKTYFEAAAIVRKKYPEITFVAIGNKTDSPEAQSLISDFDAHNYKLLGTRTGVESYVNVFDICVLSTFAEGISNSIIEYMALSKPVIATSGGGTNELIEDSKTGYLVSTANPEELAGRLMFLIENQRLRSQLGEAGKSRIENVFSIQAMLSQYITLYQEIKNKRKT